MSSPETERSAKDYREVAAKYLPAIIMGVGIFILADEVTLETTLGAIAIGFLGHVFLLFIYGFTTYVVFRISGDKDPDISQQMGSTLQIAASLSVAAIIYVWLQHEKDIKVESLIECVADYQAEYREESPVDLLTMCAESEPEYYDEF